MADYLFTSKRVSGFMKFSYDNQGVIIKFENNAILDDEQLHFLTRNFPFAEADLQKLVGKNGRIDEITDTSFQTFWNNYNYKKDRIKAEAAWKKLSEGEKAQAILGIPRYKYDCKLRNKELVYPERYLKWRRFDDE